MRLLARGLKRREIAEQLHLSIHTVDRHIADSYVKLGVHNTASAATKLMEGNLLGLVVIRPPRNIGDDEKWMDPSIVNMRCSI
ncbi:MAG: helix-turn-helix transcriptional regulator [Bacteroidetes bacterium]|nr:helix-turn-helix transcriptional regulator [Bacteroidota bacterium]